MAYRKIEARYVITTPMYLGGHASNVASERMREASFKGALRFWWRALMWNEAWQEAQGDESRALSLLRQWEGQLFGVAAEKGKDSRASMFRLRCFVSSNEKNAGKRDKLTGVGWRYLKGQGLDRPAAFSPGTTLKVALLLSPRLQDAQVAELLKALVALGLFGGIGARSRRAVGSVAIEDLQLDGQQAATVPGNIDQLEETVDWLGIKRVRCPLPPIAAFSLESRLDWWSGRLEDFAFDFLDWRSYYDHTKRPPTPKSSPNFRKDHDEMLDVAKGGKTNFAPERAVFGLPHNYFFRSLRRSVGVNYKKHERHASPYLLHYHQNGSLHGVMQTFLPNRFVENKLMIKGRVASEVSFQPDWQVVHNFMNHMGGETL